MRFLLVLVTPAILLGCATSNFTPTTMAGAQCKKECATNMQMCTASSYTCDQSYGKCIEACVDTDRLGRKP
jgi:hypothetical protein